MPRDKEIIILVLSQLLMFWSTNPREPDFLRGKICIFFMVAVYFFSPRVEHLFRCGGVCDIAHQQTEYAEPLSFQVECCSVRGKP